MADWIVFYADGSSFSSEDGAPEDAPRRGVEIIAQREDDSGRVLWWGHDYFWWLDGHRQWVGGDRIGLVEHLADPGSYKVVLIGKVVPYHAFREIYRQAVNDPRLPPKSTMMAQEMALPENQQPPDRLD